MAVSGINTTGITVGSDGKLQVSGFSSGIDWQSIVKAQIAAKRAPAVQMETKITANNTLISAYNDFKSKVGAVTTALDKLRAAPGSSTDVFSLKSVSGTSAPNDAAPLNYTATDVNNLIIASVSNTTPAGTHTLTVQQLATAHQVRSKDFASLTDPLADMGMTTGTISVNGKNITLGTSDTLADLKSKINNSGAGVTATIVSSDSTHNYLVLTANTTGEDNAITFGGSAATTDTLELTANSGADIAHELVEAHNSIIDVDGITGIERSTNSVSDVISGITFSLLQADPYTTATLKIEPDLTAIKTAINDFVTAFNDVRSFVTDQRTSKDRNNDGTIGDNEVGPLAFNQTVRDVLGKLGELASASLDNGTEGYASLSQIGIVMNTNFNLVLDDSIFDGKLLTGAADMKKLFGLTTTTSDSRVTVLGMTAATGSGTYYLNVGGTDVGGNVLSANIKDAAASGNGGADDGSVTVSNKLMTVTSGDATGLQLFFSGSAGLGAVNDVELTVSRGLADQFYNYFNDVTKGTTGTVDTLVSQLQLQNTDYTSRIDTIDTRLDVTRRALELKFTNMETALARLANLQNTISSYTDQLNSKN